MRISLAPAAVLVALALSSCGSDDGPANATDPVGTRSEATDPAIGHPTGAEDVVLRIQTGGGFVPVDYAFTNQPTLLLTGDGRLIRPADSGAAAGERIVTMEQVSVDEDLVQQILRAADDHGLLAPPPSYEMDEGQAIADAPTTTVTLSAGPGSATYTHSAYALNFDGDGAPRGGPRAELADFIDEVTVLTPTSGAVPYDAQQVRLTATPTGGDVPGADVVDWPTDAVDLAGVGGCSVVAADAVPAELADADGRTLFRQGGELYTVAGAVVLPGDTACDS